MGFFENFGSKVQSGAKKAANKSQDLIEVGKLKHKIGENEKLIKSKYTDIGKFLYAKYLQGEEVPEEVQGFVDIIALKMKDIDVLKQKIDEIKEKGNIADEDIDYEESVDSENYDDFEDVDVSDEIEELTGDVDDVIYASGDVADKAKDVIYATGDVAEDIKESAEDIAEDALDAAEDSAEAIKEAAEDAAEDFKDAVEDAAEDIEEKTNE